LGFKAALLGVFFLGFKSGLKRAHLVLSWDLL
jgi:hypothetical protein